MASKRILLCVTGLSPQIVTETLYALALHPHTPWIPTQVHLISTTRGADNARLKLLSAEPGWFHRLCRDYDLRDIRFTEAQIHVIRRADGSLLDDIRDDADNQLAADFIAETVRALTADPDAEVHASIAGGRKTMGFYLGYAMSLYGRMQDRLSHVLVTAPYESHPEFYYPTPQTRVIATQDRAQDALDTSKARVWLGDIPFVRLRGGLPPELLREQASFSRLVHAAQCTGRALALQLAAKTRTVTAGGELVQLPPKEFALLWWLAQRAQAGLGPVVCSKTPDYATAQAYLAAFRTLFRPDSLETERTEATLARGMDSTWFSPAKTKINKALVHALGETGAQPYLIRAIGKSKCEANQFVLGLDPEVIHLEA